MCVVLCMNGPVSAPDEMRDEGSRLGPRMTPDSDQGRERLTRLESQVQDVRDDVSRNERTFGPLPLAVERLQWTVDALVQRFERHEREREERDERIIRSFENQITACHAEVHKVSEAMAKREREEERRRQEAQKTEREEKGSDRTSRRAMWGLIGAAAVTGVFSLVIQVVTALTSGT